MSYRTPVLALLSLALVVACSPSETPNSSADNSASGMPAGLLASTAPEGALPVTEARAQAKDGSEVVIKGRIKDFTDKYAVFTLIDSELRACSDIPGDECPTPWDYCCEDHTKVAEGSVTVEVHGADGRPVGTSIKGWEDFDHLQTLVVKGKAVRDGAGNLRVVASTLHRVP